MSVLGILKFGGIAGVLFSNFGREAVFERLLDSSASVLVTKHSMYSKIKESISDLPGLETIIITDLAEHESEKVLSYQKLLKTSGEQFTASGCRI
jgi:acetyl-CoA synthetase